jgi:hypothetical protein
MSLLSPTQVAVGEEDIKIIDTKDPQQLKTLAQWILSR